MLDNNIYVNDNKVYYVSENNIISSIDNGTITTYGSGTISGVLNHVVYYHDSTGIRIISSNGESKLFIPEEYVPPFTEISDISVDGKRLCLYYSGDDDSERGYLYVIELDGYKVKRISDSDTILSPTLIGDYIYYWKDLDYENGPTYFLRTRFE
jgi:hypothetical protein